MQERFCGYCGRSIVPLEGWHVARACSRCPRTVYVAEPAEGGRGLRVEPGDRFVLPPGSVRLSLDPAAGSRFYRPGLAWFVQTLLSAGRPDAAAGLESLLRHYEQEGAAFLRTSPLLEGVDVDDEANRTVVGERIFKDKSRPELFAGLMASCAAAVGARIAAAEREGRTDVRDAAWQMYNAALAHALFTVKDRHFEEILWQGYQAYAFQTATTSAAAQPPAEAETLRLLRPLFDRLDEDVLHTWLADGRPIGPRLGLSGIPEETLRAHGRFFLERFERARADDRRREEDRRKDRDLLVKYLSWVVVAVSTVASGLWALLRYLEVV